MDPIYLGLAGIATMLVLAILGVPIGFAVGIIGALGLWLTGGYNMMATIMQTMPYEFVNNYTLVVLPMFVLMGSVASAAGIVTEIFTAAYRWTIGIRGGLLQACVCSSALFSALSGSNTVNCALFTKIALPEMLEKGYHRAMAAGSICAAGLLDAFIPPSLSMVIYGFLTGESIGKLLIAGLVPGLVTAGVFIAGIWVMVWYKPNLAPKITEHFTFKEKCSSLKDLWATILVVILVLGGLYAGIMPPSAAGAVGAMGVIIITAVRGRFSFKMLKSTVGETMMMTSVISVVIMGGLLFARYLTIGGFLDATLDIIRAYGLTANVFLLAVAIIYLLLGMFIDTLSIWLITVPVLHPIALSLGLHPLWFAVFILQLSSIGCVSPPVGLNLFAVMAACEGRIKIEELYLGVLPFIALEFVVLALFFVWPGMITWLPGRMIG